MAGGYGSSSGSESGGRGPSSGGGGRSNNYNNGGSGVAPPGFHYMPDGTLMADQDHPKIIYNMKGDFDKHISVNGSARDIIIYGEEGASFDLEIVDEDGKYYDFNTRTFESSVSKLKNTTIGQEQSSIINVVFPVPTKLITYTVRMMVNSSCGLVELAEPKIVKRGDGSIWHNACYSGVGGIIERKIFGSTGSTFELSCIAPSLSDSGEAWVTATPRYGYSTGAQTKATCSRNEDFVLNFSITLTATSGKSIRVIRDPDINDLCAVTLITIGPTPDTVSGEELYPRVTATDTVNGAVTSGTTVTMDTAVASKMKVGDRVTGNTALNAVTATVVSLDSTYAFTLSTAIAIADGITLSFSRATHHKWPVTNLQTIGEGMIVDPSSTTGGNFYANSTIASWRETTSTLIQQKQHCGSSPPQLAITKVVAGSSAVEDGDTITYSEENLLGDGREISANNGSVAFSPAQELTIASDANVKIYAYGASQIKKMTHMDVSLSNIKVTPTEITTTIDDASATGEASLNDFDVDSVTGIMDDVSVVSGASINVSSGEPRVTAISSSNLTLTPGSHVVTNGETLTFTGASNIITITGIISINNFTTSGGGKLYFDVERFLYSA